MSLISLDTGFNIEVQFELAPFHRRLVAWFIDLFVLLAYIYLSDLASNNLFDYHPPQWINILVFLPVVFYHLLCEIRMNGQSLGKKWMMIRVITEDGGSPTASQYILRWVFRLIDICLAGVPAIFSIMITPLSQRLGDLSAGTVLIDTRRKLSWNDTVFEAVENDYIPRYPAVMNLSDRDINTLKSMVQSLLKRADHGLALSISNRIREKFKIETEEAPEEFLRTLLKDYNYYTNGPS